MYLHLSQYCRLDSPSVDFTFLSFKVATLCFACSLFSFRLKPFLFVPTSLVTSFSASFVVAMFSEEKKSIPVKFFFQESDNTYLFNWPYWLDVWTKNHNSKSYWSTTRCLCKVVYRHLLGSRLWKALLHVKHYNRNTEFLTRTWLDSTLDV